MMSMLQTKTRIRSVTSTKKITKAMELVATSKLKKAKDINMKITPYKDEVLKIISYCALNIKDKDYKFFNENKNANKSLYIIISSTLGLCGGYNLNVLKYVLNNIDNKNDLIVIGSKGISLLKNKGYHIIKEYPELPNLNLDENLSLSIANVLLKEFDLGTYKSINMIYTRFINSLTFEPEMIKLLPIFTIVEVEKMKKELLFEPSANEILDSLVPFYLNTIVKTLLFESMLSEQASRRTAMENATDNANELEEKLLLDYNKSRQASITQEITEISGAANATR